MTSTVTAAQSIKEIFSSIKDLKVMELVELVKTIEEEFGVSAVPVAGVAAAPKETEEAAETITQTEFAVHLKSFKEKIKLIRVIKDIMSLGLSEAKALVEKTQSSPVELKAGLSKTDAETLKQQLEEAGATVEIK
jgi:large subunit ribosomal protein L7/L12